MRVLGAVSFVFATIWVSACFAQLTREDIAAIESQGKALGWTFSVGENAATRQPAGQLCGLVPPKDWWVGARFDSLSQKADPPPAAYDWRAHNGCTPIKNQGGCGSCWAFATVGPLECNIKIRDAVTVNLAEQWLVSCNQETDLPHVLGGTWGCNGGWWGHDYHTGAKTDPCGGAGAVLNEYFPYMAYNLACQCPYPHDYAMDSWAYIGEMEGIPDAVAIKQAILTYGPVSAAVFADDPFKSYRNGVFNASATGEVNHGIVLVGWDDSQGAQGVWILRNSWSDAWGEGGYMRIEYGCSSVGYGACYVDYAGKGNGIAPVITRQPASEAVPLGWQHLFSVEATGIGTLHYQWERDGEPVGTDAPTLAVEHVSYGDEGTYTCRVSDARGALVSQDAELSIDSLQSVPAQNPLGLLILALAIAVAFRTAREIPNGGKGST